jgi:MtN3 and saliva related transmembrane protein
LLESIAQRDDRMNDFLVAASPWVGATAAVLTTICWLPQAVRLVRHKDTRAISLTTNLVFFTGLTFWLLYGIAIVDWPLIASNAVSMVFTSVIVAMKLRHG